MLNSKSTILLSLISSNLGFAGSMGPVCTPEDTLNVQGGCQAVNYFNALQAQFLKVVGGARSESYGLFGPYFGVNYVSAA